MKKINGSGYAGPGFPDSRPLKPDAIEKYCYEGKWESQNICLKRRGLQESGPLTERGNTPLHLNI